MDAKHVNLYVDDRPSEGAFRVHPAAYSDPELFELEMKFIFERTWSFLAIESQIATPNDFITATIGRTPVIVLTKLRQTTVFPNMQIPEAISQLLRTFQPVAVDRTMMRVYCLAPIGERPDLRAWRLRQFEDFFNPTGIATPDDAATYEECQRGFQAKELGWLQGYSRGMAAIDGGENDVTREIGIRPKESVIGKSEMQSEVGFHSCHREWARLMEAGLAGRKAYE